MKKLQQCKGLLNLDPSATDKDLFAPATHAQQLIGPAEPRFQQGWTLPIFLRKRSGAKLDGTAVTSGYVHH